MLKKVCLLVFVLTFSLAIFAQAGPLENQLRVAILNQDIALVQEALSNGANVNYVQSDYTDNPLSVAINTGNMDVIKLLLQKGANPNIHIEGNGLITSTPLLKAISMQKFELVKLLVEYGADVNLAATKYGKPEEKLFSPLMQAIAATYTRESMQIFDFLLEKGANVNYVSSEKDTALLVAADGRVSVYKQEAAYQMAEKLLLKGADKSIKNSRGRNATDVAIESNFMLMADLLRQKRFNQ